MRPSFLPAIFFIVLINTCCSHFFYEKELHFTVLEEFSFPLLDGQAEGSKNSSIFYHNDSLYLVISDRNLHRILYYNLDAGVLVKEKMIPFFPYDNQYDFVALNMDSMLFYFDPIKKPDLKVDSSIFLVDKNYDQLKQYDFEGSGIPMLRTKDGEGRKCGLITTRVGTPSFVNKNRLFFRLTPPYCNSGDSVFHANPYPSGGHIDLSSGAIDTHPVYFPGKVGDYYPVQVPYPLLTVDEKGNPVYHFAHTDTFYHYDLSTKEVAKYCVSSPLIKKIVPQRKSENESFELKITDYYQDRWEFILYDQYRKYYLRFGRFGLPKDVSHSEVKNAKYYVEVIDENFKLIAGGVIPNKYNIYYPPPVVTERGLLFHAYHDFMHDTTKFVTVNIDFKLLDKDKLLNDLDDYSGYVRMKGSTMEEYIAQIPAYNGQKVVLFMPSLKMTCMTCAPYYDDFLSKESAYILEKEMFVILSGDKDEVDQQLYGLSENMKLHLHVDTTNQFKSYVQTNVFLPQLYRVEDGIIVSKREIKARETPYMKKVIDDFLK